MCLKLSSTELNSTTCEPFQFSIFGKDLIKYFDYVNIRSVVLQTFTLIPFSLIVYIVIDVTRAGGRTYAEIFSQSLSLSNA